MGGCMSYKRLVNRNNLHGTYYDTNGFVVDPRYYMVCGDLRRMETDQRDEIHLARYATLAGVTPEQVKRILDSFLDADCEGQTCHTVEYHDRDCRSLCHVKPQLGGGARPEPGWFPEKGADCA